MLVGERRTADETLEEFWVGRMLSCQEDRDVVNSMIRLDDAMAELV